MLAYLRVFQGYLALSLLQENVPGVCLSKNTIRTKVSLQRSIHNNIEKVICSIHRRNKVVKYSYMIIKKVLGGK